MLQQSVTEEEELNIRDKRQSVSWTSGYIIVVCHSSQQRREEFKLNYKKTSTEEITTTICWRKRMLDDNLNNKEVSKF